MKYAAVAHRYRLFRILLELILLLVGVPLLIGGAILATAGGASLPGGCVPGRAEAQMQEGPISDQDWSPQTALGGVLPEPLNSPRRFLALSLETWRFWALELVPGRVEWSWSCMGQAQLLSRMAGSLALVGAALGIGLLLALFGLRGMSEQLEPQAQLGAGAWILMAPSVLWAAVVTSFINLLVFRLETSRLELDPSVYALPGGVLWLRYAAALSVLILGGGTLYRLLLGLRAELARLLTHERCFSARANGLPVSPRLLRGMLIPTLALLVGLIPMLLGEVVVVELVFSLEGIGRELRQLAIDRDAPALMTVAVCLLLLTRGLHAAVRELRWWLEPVSREVQE